MFGDAVEAEVDGVYGFVCEAFAVGGVFGEFDAISM